jgi:hypothetical protein
MSWLPPFGATDTKLVYEGSPRLTSVAFSADGRTMFVNDSGVVVAIRTADPSKRLTVGRGVTIAFLDSGYFAHPDLVTPRNRIVAYYDVIRHTSARASLPEPDVSSWHGMMTSVVCAGNGALSHGRYKGLAHESDLVLVKVGSVSRIRHDDIRAGLDWVVDHRKQHNIRVLNISAGGDYEASYLTDALSQAADLESRAANLEAQKQVFREGVAIEATQAYQAVLESDFALTSTAKQLASAREAVRVARELFKAGRVNSTTLTDAETELTRARLQLLNARIDARTARVRLEHALGRDNRLVQLPL